MGASMPESDKPNAIAFGWRRLATDYPYTHPHHMFRVRRDRTRWPDGRVAPYIYIQSNGAVWVVPNAPWQSAADAVKADPDKWLYMYNGRRPNSGSFAIEDDGVALRELAWGHYKVQADRWFYWTSTYYINHHCHGYDDPRSYVNLFQQAQVFGCYEEDDVSLGQTGWNYFNGDGVMIYPGSDVHYPDESYGLLGPFASLRLKHWRRGIQDVDYLTLAAQIAPQRVAEIVQEMTPIILWEVDVDDLEDPTWVLTDISWPTDPDAWEAVRAELAEIIESAGD